jgi:bifunctional NMN adenylyltransferase/nudix hydrolase
MTTKNAVASYADSIWNPVTEIEDLYDGQVNDKEYDLLVFVGRLAPVHLGHMRVIDIALQKAKQVLILLGSSFAPRRPRTPWTFEERAAMIRAAYPHVPASKLMIRPLQDYTYRDEMWINAVQLEVYDSMAGKSAKSKIGLIGCSKDNSSYYLKLFPQWGNVNVRFLNPLNATDIRDRFFSDIDNKTFNINDGSAVLHPAVTQWLDEWNHSGHFQSMSEYYSASKRIKERRQKDAEYPVQDLCADALVTQSGHILLITRGGEIGKNLLAIPGGYVNPDETFLDAAIRELKEETRLKVPVPVLRGSIAGSFDADDPHRSERGRIFSKVFHFKLADQLELPEIRGSDDASKAEWIPISEIRSDNMFEDHHALISKALSI